MEGIKFRFGFGGIGDILNGRTKKFDSLKDIDFNYSQHVILVPRILGVYQEKTTDIPGLEKMFKRRNERSQEILLAVFGERETIHPDLICAAYDNDNIIGDSYAGIIRSALSGDITGRVKVVCSLELPVFDDKEDTEDNFIALFNRLNSKKKPSDIEYSLLDRAKNNLRMQRRDFGLTIREAVILDAVEKKLAQDGKYVFIHMPTKQETEDYLRMNKTASKSLYEFLKLNTEE